MNASIDPSWTQDAVADHIEQWRSHKKNGERRVLGTVYLTRPDYGVLARGN
jgi:hypothetical protein